METKNQNKTKNQPTSQVQALQAENKKLVEELEIIRKAYLMACNLIVEAVGDCHKGCHKKCIFSDEYCEKNCLTADYLCWDKYFIEKAKEDKED